MKEKVKDRKEKKQTNKQTNNVKESNIHTREIPTVKMKHATIYIFRILIS